MERTKKHVEKIRFAVVGAANTCIDFGLLLLLTNLFGFSSISANYISTSVAFVFSFFVNKSYTFQSIGGNVKKQFLLFLFITIIGLWVLQPLIIWGGETALAPLHWDENLVRIVSKLAATFVSLVWNYVFYSRFVFKKDNV
jgi:putative flippase GtrA